MQGADDTQEPNAEASGARQGVQVIERAARILRTLENEPDGLGLGTIAKRVGLARSTVQRIVGALLDERFVEPASAYGRVRLGSALVRLAVSASVDVTQFARPYLAALSRECRETVDLSVLRNNCVVFLDQVVGSHRLRTVSAIGEAFPLHASANGKALLATLDEVTVRKLVGAKPERFTDQTLQSPEALLRDLAEIRKRGYALDREEHSEGIVAIGVAAEDPRGLPFAVSIPVPAARFPAIEARLIERLLHTRSEIAQAVGESAR